MPAALRVATAAFVVLVLLLPRFVPVIALTAATPILLLIFFWDRFSAARGPRLSWVSADGVTISMLGFLGVLLLASSWSIDPVDAVFKVSFLAAISMVGLILSRQCEGWPPGHIEALAQGLVIGMAIGSIYILVETLTARELTRQLNSLFPQLRMGHEKHFVVDNAGNVIGVSHAVINRATFAYSALLWPTLLALMTAFATRWRVIIGMLLAATTASIIACSTHQSSQLSISLSLLAFLIAIFSIRSARLLVVAGTCALYLLVVPFSHYAHQAGWHLDKSVPATARARLIYWAYTAERVLERPFLGVGTNATRALDEARPRDTFVKPKGHVVASRTTAHPHNSYLQLWYEVGLLGVLAALVFHLSLLGKAFSVPDRIQRFALAHCTLMAVIIMPSYGLWQTWYEAIVGLSAFALVVAIRRADRGLPSAAD